MVAYVRSKFAEDIQLEQIAKSDKQNERQSVSRNGSQIKNEVVRGKEGTKEGGKELTPRQAKALKKKNLLKDYSPNHSLKRSHFKVLTGEAKALRFMRMSRGLSMRKAATLIEKSEAYVNHCENGRIDLKTPIIIRFIKAYGYDYEYFHQICTGEIPIPENDFDVCIEILKRLGPEKLKIATTILKNL
jgi:hypothetical protein